MLVQLTYMISDMFRLQVSTSCLIVSYLNSKIRYDFFVTLKFNYTWTVFNRAQPYINMFCINYCHY